MPGEFHPSDGPENYLMKIYLNENNINKILDRKCLDTDFLYETSVRKPVIKKGSVANRKITYLNLSDALRAIVSFPKNEFVLKDLFDFYNIELTIEASTKLEKELGQIGIYRNINDNFFHRNEIYKKYALINYLRKHSLNP